MCQLHNFWTLGELLGPLIYKVPKGLGYLTGLRYIEYLQRVSESHPALLSDSDGDAGTEVFFSCHRLLKCAQVATHRLLHYWPIKAGVNEMIK